MASPKRVDFEPNYLYKYGFSRELNDLDANMKRWMKALRRKLLERGVEEESEAAGCNVGPIISLFAFMQCPCYAIYWSITIFST
jgi:hypothetical protein